LLYKIFFDSKQWNIIHYEHIRRKNGGGKMAKKFLLKPLVIIVSGFLFLVFFVISASFAEEPALPVLKTEVKSIAIFKNGLGFFIRDGEVYVKNGWAVTGNVPNSTLGSIWIASLDKNVELQEVIGYREEIQKEIEVITIEELLKANTGKKVIITFGDKEIKGIIKLVSEDRKLPGEERDYSDSRRGYRYPRPGYEPAQIVIIDTKNGEVVLNKNTISKVEFPETPSTEFLRKEKAKRIKFKLSTREKRVRLSLSYLQKGISWVPSYLVNIQDSKKARITMKATVINDVENLEDVNVFFVVGYPNFIYADILSPMALEESITQFISALERGGRRREEYGRLANVMSQRAVGFAGGEEIPRLGYGYAAIKGLPGVSEEDLFLYNKQGVSLQKNERAYYHIFSDKVDYKHVYEWEIPDTINVDARGYYRSGQDKKKIEQVWHSVKLSNSTKYPWTTAPAFVVSGQKPLAQDTINYTPKGTKINLKLTVATDIKTDRHEYEIERQRDVRLYRRSYDLVTVKGELYVQNCKSKDVIMEIKKMVTGEVTETSNNGKIKKTAEGLMGVNSKSIISWEIPFKAGEKIDVTYKYKVYVTH